MKKKVLLLAVSCKTGGLCPGGIDLNNPQKWIRIVKDDGHSGAVQGYEIDFAKPLDIIEFDGRPMPQGKQKENWVIDNNSCRNLGEPNMTHTELLTLAYKQYAYHGFWNNYKAFLDEDEFENITNPSESILRVKNVRIYRNNFGRAKIDFDWDKSLYRIKGISMTDQEFYNAIQDNEVEIKDAYIVISIPKDCDWSHPETGEKRAYKFVSKIFDINEILIIDDIFRSDSQVNL